MVRLAGADGVVLLTHLHNLLGENESAGMPLTPADYRNLFAGPDVRLFGERDVFDALLAGRPADLSAPRGDDELSGEPALVLLATRLPVADRPPESGGVGTPTQPLSLNPLYRLEADGNGQVLRLRFPSAAYEAEYAACKQYLPARVPWGAERQARVAGGVLDRELSELVERRVLLGLPPAYCEPAEAG